jgi:hypothetical protein
MGNGQWAGDGQLTTDNWQLATDNDQQPTPQNKKAEPGVSPIRPFG